jgi:hypothetical protein
MSSKKRGGKSPFTPEQDNHIESYYAEWDLLYTRLGGSDEESLTDWKNATADKIVTHPIFAGRLDPCFTPAEWKKVSTFSLYRHYCI